MIRSGVISDELWELIEPVLPSDAGRRKRRWRDHRQVLEAIAWRFRNGCAVAGCTGGVRAVADPVEAASPLVR